MVQTPESEFKEKICKYLKSIGAFYCRVPGGANGKNGVPDIIVCYKGRFFGIEAKTYEGTFSKWQITRKAQIESAGGVCIFARSIDDIKNILESI